MDRALVDDPHSPRLLGADLLDRHQIGPGARILADADLALLEPALQAEGEVNPVRPGQQHTNHPACAVAALRILDHFLAHPGLVDPRLDQPPIGEPCIEPGVLMREALPNLTVAVALPQHVAEQFLDDLDLPVAPPRHVAAHVAQPALVKLGQPAIVMLGRDDVFQADQAARALGGHTVKLFGRIIAIAGADIGFPLLLRRKLSALGPGDQRNPLIQPVGHGIGEGDPDGGAALFFRVDPVNQHRERIANPVVGGDHHHLTAPDQQRHRRLDHVIDILVERRFVDHHDALLAAQRARHRWQRRDPEARGQPDREGFHALAGDLVEHLLVLDLARDQIEGARPHRADLDKFEGHVLVITHVPDVLAARLDRRGGFHHRKGGNAPGQPDPARLLDYQQRGSGEQQIERARLIAEQQIAARERAEGLLRRLAVALAILGRGQGFGEDHGYSVRLDIIK